MQETSISWADLSWNPTRGCSRVSPGCGGGTPGHLKGGCYAEKLAGRFSGPGQPFEGYAEKTPSGYRWTGKVSLLPKKLAEPLSWGKPQTVFVNSMSDLFHEGISFEEIAAVVGVMAACPHLTFKSLTKRAERQREWFEWLVREAKYGPVGFCYGEAASRGAHNEFIPANEWPLPNWQVGVSAEDQQRWDERVPDLMRCPAAVRFVSAEPLLSPISMMIPGRPAEPGEDMGILKLDQIIVGSESGHGARPMDTAWAESIRDQCKRAGVSFFMKQFSRKTGKKITDPAEWPAGDWPQENP